MAVAAVHADAPRGRARSPARRRLGPVVSGLPGPGGADRPAATAGCGRSSWRGVLGWEKSRLSHQVGRMADRGSGEEGEVRLGPPWRLRGRHPTRAHRRSRRPRRDTWPPSGASSSTGSRRPSSTPSARPPTSCSRRSTSPSSPMPRHAPGGRADEQRPSRAAAGPRVLGVAARQSFDTRLASLAANVLERLGTSVGLASIREFDAPSYDGDLETAAWTATPSPGCGRDGCRDDGHAHHNSGEAAPSLHLGSTSNDERGDCTFERRMTP